MTVTTQRFDVVVVGMGPGGEEVATKLAEAGLTVAGVDHDLLGGECPYWGCVPSKMAIRAANSLAEAGRIGTLSGSAQVTPSWAPVARRIRDEATDGWDDTVAVERFEGKGGRFVRGHGRVTGPGRVDVDGQQLEASRAVVVATGNRPVIPPIPGLADAGYWTNREALTATEVPRALIVLGGAAIGLELGQTFARFGSSVTVVEGEVRLLPPEEPEVGELMAAVLEREGIAVHTGARVASVHRDGGQVTAVLESGNELTADRLLVATGRRPDVASTGLDSVGVDPDAPAIPVDENMRVAPGVWAVGDATGKGAFTHVAMYQARIAIADILGRPHDVADYRALPRVTFTDPEVGSVGLTERAAADTGVRVAIGAAELPSSARGWIHKAGNEGLIKLVADRDSGLLVGATSVGPAGGEVLGLLTLAVHARIPVASLREMIYAYPTFHRAVEDALRDLDV